jgi:hypothetical protein
MGPFTRHVRDAISSNRARRPVYGAITPWALPVSHLLVALEQATLPIAAAFDAHPESHRLEAAFVEMDEAPAPGPARWGAGRRRAGAIGSAAVGGTPCRWNIRWAMARGELVEAVALAEQELDRLHALEQHHELHLAMTVHLIESIARAAAVSSTWPARCRGLGWALVRVQLAGVSLAVVLDALAWPSHARGAGILVNDLPTALGASDQIGPRVAPFMDGAAKLVSVRSRVP